MLCRLWERLYGMYGVARYKSTWTVKAPRYGEPKLLLAKVNAMSSCMPSCHAPNPDPE